MAAALLPPLPSLVLRLKHHLQQVSLCPAAHPCLALGLPQCGVPALGCAVANMSIYKGPSVKVKLKVQGPALILPCSL